jgi:predicted DNA-binding transcriptional regulator AlpA
MSSQLPGSAVAFRYDTGGKLLSTDSKTETTFRKKLSTYEAAEYLGLGKSTLDKLRVTGGGPIFIKVGKRIVYDPADLDSWFDRHKRSSTSQKTALLAA